MWGECELGRQSDAVMAPEPVLEEWAVVCLCQMWCWWHLRWWGYHSGSLLGAEEGAFGQGTQVQGSGQPHQHTH